MTARAAAALGAAFLLAATQTGHAAPICDSYDSVVATISGAKYAEQLVGRGAQCPMAVELWLGPSGSFSVMAVFDGGLACLIAVGHGWQFSMPAFGDPA